MNRIKYIKGDLLKAPQDRMLLHACNCAGNWGKGVALQIAKAYPLAYQMHKQNAPFSPGDVQIIKIATHSAIICLFTSKGYGRYVDSPSVILRNTKESLIALAEGLSDETAIVASPKINAGLFNVPWEDTEALINSFLKANPNVTWEVYTL